MTDSNLPPHIETIITEACWGVPGVGQLTGEEKLRAILEAANGVLREWDWQASFSEDMSAAIEKLREAMQEPCQRCGGEGLVVKPDAPGIRTRWYEDCPDCKNPADFPPHAEDFG